ncbi:hypothetical protein YC2023_040466 [Brassica napus]
MHCFPTFSLIPTHSFFLWWLALDRGYIKSHSASLEDPFNPSQFQKCRLPSRIISNTQLKGGGAGRKTVREIDLAGGARLRAGRDGRKRDDRRRMGLLRLRESRADNVLRFERRFVRMCCIFLIAYTTI